MLFISGEEDDERIVLADHSTWLPDIASSTELDLEAELNLRDSSLGPYSVSSARSSLEPPDQKRLPPSGRSSAERFSLSRRLSSSSSRGSSCASEDLTLRASGALSSSTMPHTSKLYLHQQAYPPSTTTSSYQHHLLRGGRSRSRERVTALHNNSLAGSMTDLDTSIASSMECSALYRPTSSVDTSGISSMNSSMMSSTSSGSLLVSSINLSPVKEALQEISSPTGSRSSVTSPRSPKKNSSVEISIGKHSCYRFYNGFFHRMIVKWVLATTNVYKAFNQ